MFARKSNEDKEVFVLTCFVSVQTARCAAYEVGGHHKGVVDTRRMGVKALEAGYHSGA